VTRFLGSEVCYWKPNRDTIWKIVTQFLVCLTHFQDKIVRVLGRTHQSWHDFGNHDTILIVTGHYLSVSVHFLRESFKREKLGKSKEVTLWLRVF